MNVIYQTYTIAGKKSKIYASFVAHTRLTNYGLPEYGDSLTKGIVHEYAFFSNNNT